MKTNFLPLAFVAGVALLMPSCRDHWRLEGNHHVVTEQRHIADFSRVRTEGDFRVYIVYDSVPEIKVEAEENLLPYIVTRSDGRTLDIEVRNNRNFHEHHPLTVHIRTPFIDKLGLQGSGYVDARGIDAANLEINLDGSGTIVCDFLCNYLDADLQGSGQLKLSGFAKEADIKLKGSGAIKAYNTEIDSIFASLSGSGSMYLTAVDLLDASINGSGTIYYKGEPEVNSHITGSGRIVHKY